MEVSLPGGLSLRVSRKGIFPKVQIERPGSYISPHCSLKGKVLKPIDLKYYSELGLPINLNEGRAAMQVDFTPRGANRSESLGDIKQAFRMGSEDYPHFLHSLGRKKFHRIDLIIGRTNPRMARYAVDKLGYHYGRLPEDPVERKKVLDDPESKITVFITRDEALKGPSTKTTPKTP